MSPKRKLSLMIPGLLVSSALVWTAVGTIAPASGQTPSGFLARAHKGERAPSFTEPIFMLLMGGDSRRGNPSQQRVDSLHIVALVPADPADPTSKPRASIVGIPRDSYVEIPGRGKNKINAASYFGGPNLMRDTVEGISGCDFDYTMLTAFDGFRGKVRKVNGEFRKLATGLIDDFGGVDFTVPAGGLVDKSAHADMRAGKQHFYGSDALAWSRARKARPRGDFDRSLAQGTLMTAVLAEARKDYADNPGTALRNLAVLRKHVKLDIPLGEALKLGLFSMKIAPSRVRNIVVDGFATTEDGSSIVKITQTGLNQLQDVCFDGVLGNA